MRRVEGLLGGLAVSAWPVLVSGLSVVLTYVTLRRGQNSASRKDASDSEASYRRDVLQENRDLRERLGKTESRADALATSLEAEREAHQLHPPSQDAKGDAP